MVRLPEYKFIQEQSCSRTHLFTKNMYFFKKIFLESKCKNQFHYKPKTPTCYKYRERESSDATESLSDDLAEDDSELIIDRVDAAERKEGSDASGEEESKDGAGCLRLAFEIALCRSGFTFEDVFWDRAIK